MERVYYSCSKQDLYIYEGNVDEMPFDDWGTLPSLLAPQSLIDTSVAFLTTSPLR